MGVRIFSDGRDPKTLASLAATRRSARQARRRRDRVLKRKNKLVRELIRFGLMPIDLAERKALTSLDPYELRAKGLAEKLEPHHLGRAIFHLARKRGFRSGRKDLQTEENARETGKIRGGIDNLRTLMLNAGCPTMGAYLWSLHEKRLPVLARPANDGTYPIYLGRELIAEEFDALWAAQAHHHPTLLNENARVTLRDTILFQRKLRPVKPGKCLYERDQDRALLAHPLSQRFRILQELANLRIRVSASQERSLTLDERDRLLDVLAQGGDALNDRGFLTWAKIRTLLSLPKKCAFNLDVNGRKGLKSDSVSIGLCAANALGARWHRLTSTEQDRFLHQLREVERRDDLQEKLREYELSDRQLACIFSVLARMPDDHGSLSLKALSKIVPALERSVLHYSDAVIAAGYTDHSQFYDGEVRPALPYYGQVLTGYTQPHDLPSADPNEQEYGRISNPTVHVGLNQLRRVVNAIIKRYGHPKQIILEVAREMGLSGEKRRELERKQRENQERNEKFASELTRLGVKNSRENRQRLQLYYEIASNDPLGAACIYTGTRISLTKLFSDEVEIDHILPFSRSLDDGMGNKLLCTRQANRDKKNQIPHEAFGALPGYDWEAILERAERLIPYKAKRFRENALQEFLKDSDFLARHLNDTAYFSRAAKEYLGAICPPNCIWVSTGRLTSLVRAKWGLNDVLSAKGIKNRNDHRHHAVDAAVIGACDRSVIKAMADAARNAEEHGEQRVLERLSTPWSAFRDDVRHTVSRIVVSHKPDHSISGGLHNETIYGLAEGPDAKGRSRVVHRIPVVTLKNRDDIEKVVDETLRRQIAAATEMSEGKEFKSALTKFSEASKVRRVRIIEPYSVQAIRNPHRDQPKFVRTDGNFCYEIARNDAGKWIGSAVSLLAANRLKKLDAKRGINGDPLLMRLHVDDILAIERAGTRELFRVAQVTDARVTLAAHYEAGALRTRDSDPTDSFKYLYASPGMLRTYKARLVGVDELGYVNDPGFRE